MRRDQGPLRVMCEFMDLIIVGSETAVDKIVVAENRMVTVYINFSINLSYFMWDA